MHRLKLLLSFLLFAISANVLAQQNEAQYVKVDKTYRYRVYLADKKNNSYSKKHPEAFLSPKAIERRKKLKIKIDKHDLPISPLYLQQLAQNGFRVYNMSKWNNTVVVELADTQQVERLQQFSFVKGVRKVWESRDSVLVIPHFSRSSIIKNSRDTTDNYYGAAYRQADMLNVPELHKAGYRGEGMTIAVIDGGFFNVDSVEALSDVRILGTRNFVDAKKSVYAELQDHGTMVLSCIATHRPQVYVGTAPGASFYLLQSEDTSSEQLVEEDNWCSAVEYADSLGVDIITSSLGYYAFDYPDMSHKYYEQDGCTALISRSASLAASRGILLLNSAGNEGNDAWKKIGFPADAHDILAVGAVDSNCRNTEFSSIGNTEDGRIKPDVMAMGGESAVFNCLGNLTTQNGTSFSCPILCGAVACLWQAFPHKHPKEIIKAVCAAGNNHEHPNNIYGHGIPNMMKAYDLLKQK